jgi:hypothetical protein
VSVEVLTLLATVVFGAAGVAAAYYGYKSFHASREQLELAREQAAQVPRIGLMEVSLRPLGEDAELFEWVRSTRQEQVELRRKRAEEQRAKREREERERREREEEERRRSRGAGFNAGTVEQREETGQGNWLESLLKLSGKREWLDVGNTPVLPTYDLLRSRSVYEGPLPDHFVDVGIRNVGRAAAYDVTGWIWFAKSVIEPVEHFASSGVEVAGEEHGKVKVELSVRNEGGRLFPSHNDPYTFRIPVRLHKAADTSLEFEFTSPQGEPAHGTFNLLLGSGSQEASDPAQEVEER